MGAPQDPLLEVRIRTIETAQRITLEKQKILKAELDKQEARFAKTMDILEDNNDAILHLQKYLSHFLLETVEQGLMISAAITKFSKFIDLPPSSSSINSFLDFAFTTIAAAFPALRLLKVLEKVDKEADALLAASKFMKTEAPVAAVVAKSVPKMGETADVLKKANDSRTKALVALKADPDSSGLTKLDAAKTPIKDLVAASNRAAATFDKVADVIAAEFRLRVEHPEIHRNETILEIAKKVLVPPDFPSSLELDQLEAAYIWYMISDYCRKNNVLLVKYTYKNRAIQVTGLNDAQIDGLSDLFGPQVPRGKYFSIPIYFFHNRDSSLSYLRQMHINTMEDHSYRFTHRG